MPPQIVNTPSAGWLRSASPQFIKYCLIGCTGATIDAVLFYLFVRKAGIPYLGANVISVTIGMTNNFFLNAYLNFKLTDNLFHRLLRFYLVGCFSLALNSLTLYILVHYSQWNVLYAKLSVIVIIGLVQFTLNRLITFRVNWKSRRPIAGEDGAYGNVAHE